MKKYKNWKEKKDKCPKGHKNVDYVKINYPDGNYREYLYCYNCKKEYFFSEEY